MTSGDPQSVIVSSASVEQAPNAASNTATHQRSLDLHLVTGPYPTSARKRHHPQTGRSGLETRQADVVLLGVNARYRHASLGLRYLLANLGEARARAVLHETTLQADAATIVDEVLAYRPVVVGISVYIWNVSLGEAVVAGLKARQPELVVVLGGPEVSHEHEGQAIVALADVVVLGEGEVAFRTLVERVLAGGPVGPAVVPGAAPELAQLESPYRLYNEEDIARRVLYVEASRGCPYRCQFCLSALDRAVRSFPLEAFLAELDQLIGRGARSFKFVDRTFNLKMASSLAILDFFLGRLDRVDSLHFEMIPDRLPAPLRASLARFPAGVVQLEVGIQTFDEATARRIERRQDYRATVANLRSLTSETGVHLHTDLIVGLPGESLVSFRSGFDHLVRLGPHEIQVGVLKRLKGAPIQRHDVCCAMVYRATPPFDVMQTGAMTGAELAEMKHFARLWDRVANSGNFVESVRALWADGGSPFDGFMAFVRRIVANSARSHSLALLLLVEEMLHHLTDSVGLDAGLARAMLTRDYHRTPRRKQPRFLGDFTPSPEASPRDRAKLARQARHHQTQKG